MYVGDKGMKSTRLKDQIHIFREENRGQKSKQQQPQIPRVSSRNSMPHPAGSPFPQEPSSQGHRVHPSTVLEHSRDRSEFSNSS